MSGLYGAIVLGSGIEGLVAACTLARSGKRVLVLEGRESVGGLAAAEEFHPGYTSAGVFQGADTLRPEVVRSLQLEEHGLRTQPHAQDVLLLGRKGEGLYLPGPTEAGAGAISRLSHRDAEQYVRFHDFVRTARPAIADFMDRPALDAVNPESIPKLELLRRGNTFRRLGRNALMELARIPPRSVADWLREWFETESLIAGLSLPAVSGNYMGPRSPQSAANLLLRMATTEASPVGGARALLAALERTARVHGVEIRTAAPVAEILVDQSATRGVRLSEGTEILCDTVLCAHDPHRLLELLPAGSLPHRLEERLRNFRMRGTTSQLLLALEQPIRFAQAEGQRVEYARLAPGVDAIEQAFDAVKYGKFVGEMVLEVHVPTVSAPQLAPNGHEVVSILAHFTPYDLRPKWDGRRETRLTNRILTILERYAPGVKKSAVARVLRTPPMLETEYGIHGGHLHEGELALDQILVRPAPECADHATPVTGLYLCGPSTHPGIPGPSGMNGLLAARRTLA